MFCKTYIYVYSKTTPHSRSPITIRRLLILNSHAEECESMKLGDGAGALPFLPRLHITTNQTLVS
jgi:hypothetical protein